MPAHDPALQPCVEITVIEIKGSAPRESGARMFWFPDGSSEGTIGGGNLEMQCLAESKALWADHERATAILEYPLSEKLGQCCGGLVRVFLMKREPRREVLICGAGHVGAELAHVLAESPFHVTVADEREAWAVPRRFPEKARLIFDDPRAAVRESGAAAERTMLLIMTHDHRLDQELCQLALRYPFAWIGLIGSRTKWRRFRQRLAARGFGEHEISRIISPIGYPGLGRTPREIAIGVAAQLLALYHGAAFEQLMHPDVEEHSGQRAGLILAGGEGRRMGRWKGGVEIDGEPLIAAHARVLEAAGADLWKAVYAEPYREEAERLIPPGHRIPNPAPEAPLFASLQRGLRDLVLESPDLDSVTVVPVDTLPLESELLSALWDRHEASGAWVTQPAIRTADPARPIRHGHPIVIGRRFFPMILAADPETARLDFLVRDLSEDRKAELELDSASALANLNTPEDVRRATGE